MASSFQNSNPFFSGVSQASSFEPAAAPQGDELATVAYAMIPAAPPVDVAEIESAELATEVVVRWGDSVLHLAHLEAGRSFAIGEDRADLVLPADKLGRDRLELVRVDAGRATARVPAGAAATIEHQGARHAIEAAVAAGLAVPVGGEFDVVLIPGVRARIELAEFTFELASVAAGRKVAGHARPDGKSFGLVGLSFALHAGLFAAMFAFVPALASTEDGELGDDRKYVLMQALKSAQERELEDREQPAEQTPSTETQGGAGGAAKGESGKMGASFAKAANATYGVAGQAKERTLSREAAIADARDFGMVGLLASLPSSDPNAPVAAWGDIADGPDAKSALGNLWGQELGESYGENGLGLTGIGEGAGGKWNGVGLGSLDTIGHGAGSCLSAHCQGIGNGTGTGHLPGGHKPTGPGSLRQAETTTSGRLPADVIQRVVRQNFGRFRGCYEGALRSNPSLQGRVSVSFVIGRDGSVTTASNGGSDLPDGGVVSCVVKQFYGLSFPAPEAGVVRVTYPIVFNPN